MFTLSNNLIQINAKEAADRCTSDSKSHSYAGQREQQRGKEALQRVKVQRDYKNFMGSLSLLARQNAALTSCSGAPERPWIKVHVLYLVSCCGFWLTYVCSEDQL